MTSRAVCYLGGVAAAAALVGADGHVAQVAPLAELVEAWHDTPVDVICCDDGLLLAIIDVYIAAGAGAGLDVALRSAGATGSSIPLAVRVTGWRCRWLDGRGQLPEGDLDFVARSLALPLPDPTDAAAAARRWRDIHAGWVDVCRSAGVELRLTLAATAAALGIPSTYRAAHRAVADKAPQTWQQLRHAYYGGRVTCRAPGWRGTAVEYDLKSAYGWALTQPLPDWKIYDRKPYPSQPAWYDATVELPGLDLGPLPFRPAADACSVVLQYPQTGQLRGWYTRLDLDLAVAAGARVLQTHAVMAGRWSLDLAPTVELWLELRQRATCPLVRSLFKLLPNSLAGKLAQRTTAWVIWPGGGDLPPDGAVPLGLHSAAWAVPVVARFQPVTIPQAASYITAAVRAKVWPELSRRDALYSDTDSIHLPVDAAPPAGCGDGPGQWRESVRGAAWYVGPKRYIIGRKNVNLSGLTADSSKPNQTRRMERQRQAPDGAHKSSVLLQSE